MKTRVLTIALAALALSVGTVFALPPTSAVLGANPCADNHDVAHVSDADMAAVTGGAWWSGACTGAIHVGGVSLVIGSYIYRNPLMRGVGIFALRLECV